MSIHQIQLRYDPLADRLLLSVRTRDAALYTAWITRRMAARLHAPLAQAVGGMALRRSAPGALPVPEAQAMLVQAARERPLPTADFRQPFVEDGASRPLGAEPLLPAKLTIDHAPGGQLLLVLAEDRGRHIDLRLGDDLAAALLRLLEQSLRQADWGLALPAPAAAAAAPAPRTLN
ncbi:MAG: hypothetical protein HYZ20_03930 [Burkholderiales bacterium]|nr:hypothetical protein [Burkholderiales bacterium]